MRIAVAGGTGVVGRHVVAAVERSGHEAVDLVRRLMQARRVRRPYLPVRIPGRGGRAMATGALLPTFSGPRGRQTFAQWLAASQ